jgi:chromosome partitioning protein
MFIVAVIQQKGGTGKTTLSVNLAAAAHVEGHRTLILDMDRQKSAFDWSNQRPEGSALEGLDVVQVDTRKAFTAARFHELAQGYDVVILDGPARLDDVTQSLALVADVAVIPVMPGPYDFWALEETIAVLEHGDAIRGARGRPPLRRVFVINGAAARSTLTREAEVSLLAEKSAEIGGTVRLRRAFPATGSRGESVITLKVEGSAAAADEIKRLWRALKRISGQELTLQAKPTKKGTKATHGTEHQEAGQRERKQGGKGGGKI